MLDEARSIAVAIVLRVIFLHRVEARDSTMVFVEKHNASLRVAYASGYHFFGNRGSGRRPRDKSP